MAITSKKITVEESIEEQLSDFVLESGTHYADSSREAVNKMMGYLTNKRVIDLGCGDGAATGPFTENEVKVIGVDINPNKLRLNPTPYVKQDMVGYLEAQPDNSIPNIFCHHSLEHVPNPQKVLDLISEKLARGGIMYIEVPSDDYVHSVHHSTFDTPRDITPPRLKVLESGTTDAHYVVAKKV